MPGTSAAEHRKNRAASARVPAHPHARGIDHREEHVFVAPMLPRALIAEPSFTRPGTLGADAAGVLPARIAWDKRRLIPGQNPNGFTPRCTLSFRQEPQRQLRRGAEIVLIEKLDSGSEHVVEFDVHAISIGISDVPQGS